MKKFSIVALIKTETEATDCLKKATDVAYLQIDFFGNDRGVTSGIRTGAQEKEQKKLMLKNLIDTFKIYGIFNGGWRQVIRRWKF